jgi:hypothetical protein
MASDLTSLYDETFELALNTKWELYAMHDELVSVTFRNLPMAHGMYLDELVRIILHYLNEFYLDVICS